MSCVSPLRRDFADQHVAGVHFRADVDDARFVEASELLLRQVRDVARDFLGAQLGVARHHHQFLDVDRGVAVFGDDAFADEDRVLEVVAVPRHEGDEHIAAKREIAEIGRRTVRDDIALVHEIADTHQRLLIDAGRLVRTLELHEAVDINAGLAGIGLFRRTHDDTRRIDLIDETRTPCRNSRTRIPRDNRFHASADERRIRLHKRHRLALHVRAHQSAVRVIVLEERDQRGLDRHELIRRHIHEVDAIARNHDHIA